MVLALLGGPLAYMYWPMAPVEIIVSRETTHILGPLNPDGTPNYVKYLDDKYAEGVTPENNAAPLLLRALGPKLLPPHVRAESLRRLNLPADIFDGDKHFIGWYDRARAAMTDANGASDANSASLPGQEEDELADGPSVNDVVEMLLAGQVHPDLEAWLASNAEPLDLACQASAKDRYYMPLVSTSTPPMMLDVSVPSFCGFRDCAEALAARAILKISRGDPRGAWDDVLAAHRLARLLGQTPILLCQMVALDMEETASRAGIVLATTGSMTAEQLRELSDKLNALGPVTDIVRTIDEGERFSGLDAAILVSRGVDVQTLFSMGPFRRNGLYLDTNQMLRDMNAWYDRMVKPMRLPRFQGRKEAQKAFDDERMEFAIQRGTRATPLRMGLLKFGGRLTRQALTEVTSDYMVCCMLPSSATACDLEDQHKMAFEIETLAVALACFHREHARWPTELKELCPSLLKVVPADRFSVKPLVYRPTENGYLLYSVGQNLTDDGGQREPRGSGKSPDERKDDIVAEVKPVEAGLKPAASQP